LVAWHHGNQDLLGSKVIGEDADSEPALNCVLRLLLRSTNLSECIAAEYVFKCFCEGNPDGQTMLASTITPLPQSHGRGNNRVVENEKQMSFGRCGGTLKVHPFLGGCWVFVVSGMKSSYTLVFRSIPTLIDSPLCDTVCWCKHLSLVMVAMILRCLCPETPLMSFINICSIPR
jgi:hypothetical protein